MEQKKINIKELLAFTYNSIVNDIGLWLGLDIMAILIFILGIILGALVIIATIPLLLFFPLNILMMMSGFILFRAITGIIVLGMSRVSLDVYDTGSSTTSRLWSNNHLLVNYVIASLLYTLMVLAGLALLIVPGVILALKFSLYATIMVDRNLGPIEALKASYNITKGYTFQIFIIAIVLSLLCAIPIVGFLFAMAMEHLFEVYVYRHLTK